MQERALKILVTNDDGYSSKGINTLERLLVQYGDVLSVAPKDAQSAKSTALTMDVPLRLFKVESKTFENGHTLDKYHLNGTPVDCVKAAIVKFFEDPNLLPDVVVSGINHGSNASAAALYSGTLGATKEGALYGIPSIGFSLDNIYNEIGTRENLRTSRRKRCRKIHAYEDPLRTGAAHRRRDLPQRRAAALPFSP